MSDKERLSLASDARELATLADGCERRATNLLMAVTRLSVLLENPKETPRADGGRPLRHVSAVWEDAVEWITSAQQTAAACADDVFALIPEIEYCAEEIEAAKEKQKAAENRAGELADIYGHLFALAVDLLSPEDREKHREFTEKCRHRDK